VTDRGSEFDFAAFKSVLGRKDLDSQVSFYAYGAEWNESRPFPPRSPNLMVGKQPIANQDASIRPCAKGATGCRSRETKRPSGAT